MMRHVLFTAVLMLGVLAGPVWAQNIDCVPTTVPAIYVAGVSRLTHVSLDHNTLDASNQPIITSYLGEVFVQGQPTLVTNFTVPRAAVLPSATGPANCYTFIIPAMAGLLSANTYVIRLTPIGPTIGVRSADSGPFTLPPPPVVPRAPTSLRFLAGP